MSDPQQFLTEISTWTGEGDPDTWPYPDEMKESLVTGELANRVRVALGVSADEDVFLTETKVSSGYSEYTQENFTYIKVVAGGQSQTFDDSYANNFATMMKWLDENTPPPTLAERIAELEAEQADNS